MLNNWPVLSLVLVALFCTSLQAESLRISPEDLRLRVAVSEELPASIRQELRSLARSTPLPLQDGLLQTERLLQSEFQDRGWNEKRQLLVRYYFLVARLDQSQQFSEEFKRRRGLLQTGRELLKSYVQDIDRLVSRSSYAKKPPVETPQVQSFPLHFVTQDEDGGFTVLRHYPKAELALGRNNLRSLRSQAKAERKKIENRLKKLEKAEKSFLTEVSHVGRELIALRPLLRPWVKVPGEGLPFSR